jgi:hypothetical protein
LNGVDVNSLLGRGGNNGHAFSNHHGVGVDDTVHAKTEAFNGVFVHFFFLFIINSFKVSFKYKKQKQTIFRQTFKQTGTVIDQINVIQAVFGSLII